MKARDVLGPGGLVERRLSGFEDRPEQLRMAERIEECLAAGRHLLVEAGTGVGKSFAYLVPAVLRAEETGEKVVVATHTIALQEQLLEKDLPFLSGILPAEFSVVLDMPDHVDVQLRPGKWLERESGRTQQSLWSIGSQRCFTLVDAEFQIRLALASFVEIHRDPLLQLLVVPEVLAVFLMKRLVSE